eukprot:TRINITY_DN684_c2_g2_i1.p1 TRINITY_DN684_c2_g2~~TRINITY_DN684_c2_g2_i1.p1  ORF type:complete len:621 (-),score=92.25 TRINITY_DN684_c2_g2_i1:98-1717(-)
MEEEPYPGTFVRPEFDDASLNALTWNTSAVNNNPFEYWLTYRNEHYVKLMMGVECFLDDPGEEDVAISEVFTEDMFLELIGILEREKVDYLHELKEIWWGGDMHLSERHIISGFVKDVSFGAKRLISMPDRVTNTINVVTRKESVYQPPPCCRPSVMNNFEGDLSSTEVWWEQWKVFMFHSSFTVRTKNGHTVLRPLDMIEPIVRSKYPALTEEEERVSVPLQILCLAIFDAIIVHLMNKLSPENTWQVVKAEICDKLYRNKHKRTVEILAEVYAAVDVMCLQEVAAVFQDAYQKSPLCKSHNIFLPVKLDGKRDQNSVILLSKDFPIDTCKDVTSVVAEALPPRIKLMDGDLLVIEAVSAVDSKSYLFVSFHGDTNGLMTLPVLAAFEQVAREQFDQHRVVIGLDANTYEKAQEGQQSLFEFFTAIQEMDLTTVWGDSPTPRRCRTTCSARTSLQPQLNKAVRYCDRVWRSSMDPKDFILFKRSQMQLVSDAVMGRGRQLNPMKDNTGHLHYLERTVFPTLGFPSDHGILAASMQAIS